jgi:hypothetical protein
LITDGILAHRAAIAVHPGGNDRFLLIVAVAAAAWPVTVVTGAGYAAAWLRGWPPARLRRAAAAALPMTAVWVLLEARRQHQWRAFALAPVRDWQSSSGQLTGPGVARTFLLLVPVAVPAGLVLAAGLWAWWRYAVTSGIRGWLASAPATFDGRLWRREVRTAKGRIAAPGAVPLMVCRIIASRAASITA